MLCFQLCSIVTQHYKQRTVQEVFAINSVAMQNIAGNKHNGQHSHREATSRYCKSTSCVVSEKNWNTKDDKGKSMVRALYVLQLAKRHISAQSDVNQ